MKHTFSNGDEILKGVEKVDVGEVSSLPAESPHDLCGFPKVTDFPDITLLEALPDPSLVIDPSGAIINASSACQSLFGMSVDAIKAVASVDELLGDGFLKHVLESDRCQVAAWEYTHRNPANERRVLSGSVKQLPIPRNEILCTLRDITEQKNNEQALRDRAELYYRGFQYAPIPLLLEDLSETKKFLLELDATKEGGLERYLDEYPETWLECVARTRYLDINQTMLREYGAESKEDFVARFGLVARNETYTALKEILIAIARNEHGLESDAIDQSFQGQKRWMTLKGSWDPEDRQTLRRTCFAIVDLTRRILAEQKLQESLEEKEILVREIHHRVKNNFLLVSNLLKLQARRSKDESAANLLEEAELRVRLMGMVHEKLYQSKNLARLDAKEYLNSLTSALRRIYRRKGRKIKLYREIESVSCSIDTAIPLGFLTSELVSNCMKHAFEGRREGEIRVSLRTTGEDLYELLVADDGVGISEQVDLQNLETVGLELVKSFAEQLGGQLHIAANRGTIVTFRFNA